MLDFLITVKTFLDANTNEVVTLLFTNPEGISVSDVWLPVFEDSGGSQIHLLTSAKTVVFRPHADDIRPAASSIEVL